MTEAPTASTFIIRLVHQPAGSVSGVIERVRTGIKEKFDGREAFCQLLQKMLVKDKEES